MSFAESVCLDPIKAENGRKIVFEVTLQHKSQGATLPVGIDPIRRVKADDPRARQFVAAPDQSQN